MASDDCATAEHLLAEYLAVVARYSGEMHRLHALPTETSELTEIYLAAVRALVGAGRARKEYSVHVQAHRCRRDDLRLKDAEEHLKQPKIPALLTIRTGISLADVERLLISATILHTMGNLAETASILGINRSTLYDKLKRYGIAAR